MFDGKRYATSGIMSSIPGYMQNLLWFLIEIMDVESKDYLQIIELDISIKDGKPAQMIIHRQEQPLYIREHVISVEEPLIAKIFLIDDGTNSIMLLADEY